MTAVSETHPRLYFSAADIPLLREKRTADATARAIWERVLQKAEQALKRELPRWSYSWEYARGPVGAKGIGNLVTESQATRASTRHPGIPMRRLPPSRSCSTIPQSDRRRPGPQNR